MHRHLIVDVVHLKLYQFNVSQASSELSFTLIDEFRNADGYKAISALLLQQETSNKFVRCVFRNMSDLLSSDTEAFSRNFI